MHVCIHAHAQTHEFLHEHNPVSYPCTHPNALTPTHAGSGTDRLVQGKEREKGPLDTCCCSHVLWESACALTFIRGISSLHRNARWNPPSFGPAAGAVGHGPARPKPRPSHHDQHGQSAPAAGAGGGAQTGWPGSHEAEPAGTQADAALTDGQKR